MALALAFTLAPAVAQDEQPLLTIACLSDVHSMGKHTSPSSGKIDDITVRPSFTMALQRIQQDEDIDILIMGGDYISNKTLSRDVFVAEREALAQAATTAFRPGKPTKVLWMSGNHEYETANYDKLPKPYNSGDFYTFPMKEQTGELPAKDAYYETAANDSLSPMKLLAAYYYNLYGYDFVVLNCGAKFFASASDYSFTQGSVDWVVAKLQQLYADDPDRLVFFLCHMPFSDSNSLNSGKGMTVNDASKTLKDELLRHPNLVMLYGHDHGGDQAFTRNKTSQRATLYDTDGNVLPTTDERHLDEDITSSSDPTMPDADGSVAAGNFWLWNDYAQAYLTTNNFNLTLNEGAGTVRIGHTTEGFVMSLSYHDGTYYHTYDVNHGAKTMFGKGDTTPLRFYHVENPEAEQPRAVLVQRIIPGDTYIIVHPDGDELGYAMMGTMYKLGTTAQRVNQSKVTLSADTLIYLYPAATPRLLWRADAAPSTDPLFCSLYNPAAQRYLSVDAYNLKTDVTPWIIRALSHDDAYRLQLTWDGRSRHVHLGTNAQWSWGDATDIRFFEVADTTAALPHAVKASSIRRGGNYILVAYYATDQAYYAMTGNTRDAGTANQRVNRVKVEFQADTLHFLYPASAHSLIWTVEEAPHTQEQTSFTSLFMGSLRYYYNSINNGDPADAPDVVQGLMVYVYPDHINFQIRNYNQTGIIHGFSIQERPASYTITGINGDRSAVDDLSRTEVNGQRSADIYDLQGRRVVNPARGLYIRNGKIIHLP